MEEIRTSKKMPIGERIAIIIACSFVFLGLLFIGFKLYFRLPHSAYYAASVAAFEIPGTDDGFVAQGLDYDATTEQFVLSGYMKDGSHSPLILVSRDGKSSKSVYPLLPDGTPYTGHGGGIALTGGRLYLSGGGDGLLYLYDFAEICATENGGTVASLSETLATAVSETDYVGPAFICDTETYLITGEFYREGDYPTPDSHKYTTAAGDYHQALAVVWRLDATSPDGVEPQPVAALSLPDQVQGMAITADRVYLSTSWGLSRSHILTYDTARIPAAQQGSIDLLGTTLPLYALDSAGLVSDTEIPPMSEELAILDGRLYVMCEAASDKYIFGKFTGAEYCYATELTFFEKKS